MIFKFLIYPINILAPFFSILIGSEIYVSNFCLLHLKILFISELLLL
jgi:hypothetical protein